MKMYVSVFRVAASDVVGQSSCACASVQQPRTGEGLQLHHWHVRQHHYQYVTDVLLLFSRP